MSFLHPHSELPSRARRLTPAVAIAAAFAAAASLALAPTSVAGDQTGFSASDRHASFVSWDSAADFDRGTRQGVSVDSSGHLTLADSGTSSIDYTDPFADDAQPRTYESGTWTSPETDLDFPAT